MICYLNILTTKKATQRYMRDYQENGLIEAYQILEEKHGELITAPIEWGESLDDPLRAEEALIHAIEYVEDQIPPYLRGTY